MDGGGGGKEVEMRGLQGDKDKKEFLSLAGKNCGEKGEQTEGTGPGQSCYNPSEDSFAND